MKQGLTLQELAVEIDRQAKMKKDYIADTSKMTVFPATTYGDNDGPRVPERLVLANDNGPATPFNINGMAHSQIATWAGVPQKYYDRMKVEAPDLWAENVNHWFHADKYRDRRMLRTLDGTARAFLSRRYRRLDNHDMALAVLPQLQEYNGLRFESTQITENRMYIKAVYPRIEREVKRGDVVQAGILLSNSEIGNGPVVVQPLIFRLVCLNGLVVNDLSQRRYHVGRDISEGDAAMELYADDTMKADDNAFWLKVRDTVKAALTESVFERAVEKMRAATEGEKLTDPVKAVEELSSRYTLTKTESTSVLTHLIEGGDLSKYGVLNAITRASQDVEDYDRATTLEYMGGQVLELPRSDWQNIAKAA